MSHRQVINFQRFARRLIWPTFATFTLLARTLCLGASAPAAGAGSDDTRGIASLHRAHGGRVSSGARGE